MNEGLPSIIGRFLFLKWRFKMFDMLSVRNVLSGKDRLDVNNLLKEELLFLEPDLDETYGVYSEGNLLATGSIKDNSLRCIAVKSAYHGTEVINKLMTTLITRCYEKGLNHLFIFTKPDMAMSFTYFGFKEIVRTDDVALMEKPNLIQEYLKTMSNYKRQGRNGAIVMNGNPFTKGHLYLVEKAADRCDHLYVFVVSENASVFEPQIRFKLIQRGTAHLKNITVLEGGSYIISKATFPGYFLGQKNKSMVHGMLDLKLFSERIAPCLNIVKRFVGTEPYCENTKAYNEEMKKIFKMYDIEFIEIERKAINGDYISASKVRQAILNEDSEALEKYLPKTTLDYFDEQTLKYYRERLKNRNGRH